MTKCVCGAKATKELVYASGPDTYAVLDVCEAHEGADPQTLLVAQSIGDVKAAKRFLGFAEQDGINRQIRSNDNSVVAATDGRK